MLLLLLSQSWSYFESSKRTGTGTKNGQSSIGGCSSSISNATTKMLSMKGASFELKGRDDDLQAIVLTSCNIPVLPARERGRERVLKSKGATESRLTVNMHLY